MFVGVFVDMVIYLDYVEDFMVIFIVEVCVCILVVFVFEMLVSEFIYVDFFINLVCVLYYILVRFV